MSYVQDYIGPYRLLSMIRTGANCQVWEVLRASDNERLALKAILSEHRKSRAHIAGLKAEYEIGSKMDCPYVVKAVDFGVEDGIGYLVMELFTAQNLKQLLQLHRQGAAEVKQFPEAYPKIVEHAAEGLAYLHGEGWLHRDVKPHNFLATADGVAKLIDFSLAQKMKTGLAKFFGGRAKKVQGTRSYMSPEQIRGKALDVRADIYSFGCTIFELFSGKPPYTGISADDLLMKHLRAQVPTLEVGNKDVTPEFAGLIRRCMAKEPAGRPKSMQEFLEQLRILTVYKAGKEVSTRS